MGEFGSERVAEYKFLCKKGVELPKILIYNTFERKLIYDK